MSKGIKRSCEECGEALIWRSETASSIEKRSYKESYIFFCENRTLERINKGLKKWVMRLLRLENASTNNGTIFVYHRHTVSNCSERDDIDIFLENILCSLGEKEIRKSMNNLPCNT